MPDKVTLSFNGRTVETTAGKPIIALSQELGEEIPHFCYHPGLGIDGNCRMCLVELQGAPKLVTACTLTAAAGMKIVTNSEKVIKARQGVLEFFLVNHPLDCPICDKGGECPLQEYTRLHGPAHSRLADGKVLSFKHRIIGEHIIFDNERCIRCSRCIRFQRDVVGREELTFSQRGDHVTIELFEGQPLTSGFTGNLADLCPVGALTTREFRFQARPWEMAPVSTACGGCSLACAATAWWKKDAIIRLTADVDHRINDWWICDRGRFTYPVADQLQGGQVRRQGEQVPVDYAEAAARARELLASCAGRGAVLAGSCASNEELALLAALQEWLRPELDCFPAVEGELGFLAALRASGLEITSLADVDLCQRAIVLGLDPELSHPILALRLGQATARGGLELTLVHAGDSAAPGDFTRSWRRVREAPAAWLADQGPRAMAGEDTLLIVLNDELLRQGAVDAGSLALWRRRAGRTFVLLLSRGMNRRGLLEAALARSGRRPLLAALEAGEIDTLLVFGVDPAADFEDRERWEKALTRARRLILQSTRLPHFAAGAELVLTRRRAVDLTGSFTNGWGLIRPLATWRPVAGDRRGDMDWFAPLLGAEAQVTSAPAGGHEG